MNLKVGDKVKLKEGLIPYNEYGDKIFFNEMKFINQKEISQITEIGSCAIITEDWGLIYYSPEMLELVPESMDIQQIIDRNYQATVKRNQINNGTNFVDFINKLKEEVKELDQSLDENYQFDPKELADIALVCFSMAKHYNIDLLKVMEEKTLYNEQRED